MNELLIDPVEAARLVNAGTAYLLDVVTESAWQSLRQVPSGALRIPPEEISTRLSEVPLGRTVIAFCT